MILSDFQECSQGRADSAQRVPWVCSLPPTWKADVKEGAPAIMFDREAAMSREALC